jgi:hypothetical protein
LNSNGGAATTKEKVEVANAGLAWSRGRRVVGVGIGIVALLEMVPEGFGLSPYFMGT